MNNSSGNREADERNEHRIDAALFEPVTEGVSQQDEAACAAESFDEANDWEGLASLVLASGAMSGKSDVSEAMPAGWEDRLLARFEKEIPAEQSKAPISAAVPSASSPKAIEAATKVTPVPSQSQVERLPSNQSSRSSWLLALALSTAASFAGGWFVGQWKMPTNSQSEPVVAAARWAERYRELEALPTTTKVEWKGNEQGEIAGFVVWNDELQEGYMAFEQLAANDPSIEQYQLWIFDTARSDEQPVDGGVFNFAVDSAFNVDGRTLVPIDAKLPITHAKMFALTVEAPGGVVVSSREKLPGLAVVP